MSAVSPDIDCSTCRHAMDARGVHFCHKRWLGNTQEPAASVIRGYPQSPTWCPGYKRLPEGLDDAP